MLNKIMNQMEKCVSGIFRGCALDVMESYKAGTITLEEVSELIERLARMEKYFAFTLAAMRKALASEGGANE